MTSTLALPTQRRRRLVEHNPIYVHNLCTGLTTAECSCDWRSEIPPARFTVEHRDALVADYADHIRGIAL